MCKFTCASCSSSYIGETYRHFKTRIEKHIKKDNKHHIFKHLHTTATCFDSCNPICFKVIDWANSKFDLRIKEALQINWRKPNLNAQQNHLALPLIASVSLATFFLFVPLVFLFFSFFCNSLSSVFIISTLIIGTLYCLNYTLLLFHLFMTQLVTDFIMLCN